MTKLTDEEKQKKASGKNAAKAAQKKKQKNIAEKAAAETINKIASDLPHGAAKSFLKLVQDLRDSDQRKKAEGIVRRGIRAKLKEIKIELRVLDHTLKLQDMEPEDALSFKATQAIYEEQLGMDLTEDQKKKVSELNEKREAARVSMAASNGGSTGKEIGSGTEEDEPNDDLPARNEAVASQLRVAAINTH